MGFKLSATVTSVVFQQTRCNTNTFCDLPPEHFAHLLSVAWFFVRGLIGLSYYYKHSYRHCGCFGLRFPILIRKTVGAPT